MLGNMPGNRSQDSILDNKNIAAHRDPRRVDQLKEMSLSAGNLIICEVHDVIAYGNSYIVKGQGTPHLPACLLSSTSSFLPIGGRDCATIMPGSLVLCYVSQATPVAIIVGVLPTAMGGPGIGLPDSIVPAGHAGMFVDSVHWSALQQESAHGFLDLSAGRPVDSLPGDWGYINELGVGVFIGKLMAFLRAGEFCKFEVNYEDQLARIAAFNYEHLTSGSEEQAFNDEGEWTSIRSFNPYPWEAAGMVTGDPFTETGAELKGSNEKFGMEPAGDMQTGLFRMRTFEGFLGDLRRTIVTAPVSEMSGVPMEFGRTSTPYQGLLEEVIGVDGAYTLRSAKGISFQKTCWIPVPFEKMPRDNPEGDTGFDDYAGKDADYKMGEIPPGDTAGAISAALDDKQAYRSQHLDAEGLNIRTKDWGVEDNPPRTPGDFDVENKTPGPYSGAEAPLPEFSEVEIDHRGSRYFFKSKAFFELLDDGGIAFGDAYGSRITLTGGNIEITCPGNVIARPGRDFINISGQDTIIKAHKDVDISSATGNMRQKAEKNFMILGGNDGTAGGVLIENRASGSPNYESTGEEANIGGLQFKSAAGPLSMWGKSLNLMSLSGDIVVDAGSSTRNIIMFSSSTYRYVRTAEEIVISPKGESATPPANMSFMRFDSGGLEAVMNNIKLGAASLTLLPRSTKAGAGMSITHKGNAIIEGRYSATGDFSPIDTKKSPIDFSPAVKSMSEYTDDVNADTKTTNRNLRDDETSPLNEGVYTRAGVTFRTSKELGMSSEFVLYQTKWQQSFKISSGAQAFVENEIVAFLNKNGAAGGTSTMPYPGKDAWETEDTHFAERENVYKDDSSNGSKPKTRTDGVYDEDPEKPEFQYKTLKDNYLVNNRMASGD